MSSKPNVTAVLALIELAVDPEKTRERVEQLGGEIERLNATRNSTLAAAQAAARDREAAEKAAANARAVDAQTQARLVRQEQQAVERDRALNAREQAVTQREQKVAAGEKSLAEREATFDRVVKRMRAVTATSDAA